MSCSLPFYHVDAFAEQPFEGNPAAVCLVDTWWPQSRLAAVAAEFNLSETAFVKPEADHWSIRWFTPLREVDLCGHATLAAAAVLLFERGVTGTTLTFVSRSGMLGVTRQADGRLELDFPARPAQRLLEPPGEVAEALGKAPSVILGGGEDLLCIFRDENTIRALHPDFSRLAALDTRGVIVTAPGADCDFVSRFFAPRVGVNEDPVTGSAHTTLAPYWAERLGRNRLTARQVSKRGGRLQVELRGERVGISGRAVIVAAGTLRG